MSKDVGEVAERSHGYYWVKIQNPGDWEIAELDSLGNWWLMGTSDQFACDEFDLIGSHIPHDSVDLLQSLSERVEELEADDEARCCCRFDDRSDSLKKTCVAHIAWKDKAVAEARNQALEEAAQVARGACLVPPDGGCPTEEEAKVCEEAARQIRSLKHKG